MRWGWTGFFYEEADSPTSGRCPEGVSLDPGPPQGGGRRGARLALAAFGPSAARDGSLYHFSMRAGVG